MQYITCILNYTFKIYIYIYYIYIIYIYIYIYTYIYDVVYIMTFALNLKQDSREGKHLSNTPHVLANPFK